MSDLNYDNIFANLTLEIKALSLLSKNCRRFEEFEEKSSYKANYKKILSHEIKINQRFEEK